MAPSAPLLPKRAVKRISVFNHKGGVGKTTLTMNVAAALARSGKRVLLVDSDPQCNLTSYLVADEVVDDLLDKSDSVQGQTLWSAVRPISEGAGELQVVTPIETGVPGLFLLPGDIRLSEFETDLVEFWSQCLQRKLKGFRGTSAISRLVTSLSDTYSIDYVFYDSGPNIGALNRSILLDCDYFVVPVACDLFSLRALRTLGRTLFSWIQDWKTISDLAPEGTYLLEGTPRFLGYVPSQFRVYGGIVVEAQSRYLSRIEKEIGDQVVRVLARIDPNLVSGRPHEYKLGDLRDFGSLVPRSQEAGLPLYEAGSDSQRQREAWAAISAIAGRVIERIESFNVSPP